MCDLHDHGAPRLEPLDCDEYVLDTPNVRTFVEAVRAKMGGGIGQWLLFRSADRALCLFSLVVPSGSRTPIHDHGAWGLVGLFRGNQDEELYRPLPGGGLDPVRRRPLEPGDWYPLVPPDTDVHRVRTTSAETSVSIHLLANDTGCVLRHVYDDRTGDPRPFRSGYVNAACPEGDPVTGG